MKKVLAIVLCAVMLSTIIGCSSKNNDPSKNQPNNVESNAGNSEKSNFTIYFGKVKSIVGNEIELELAENQEDLNEEGKNNKVESLDELGPGASRDDAASDIGTGSSGESEGASENAPAPEVDNSNKLELKYTGERKSLTVPAGVQIIDTRSGSESKLTSIKSGTVIRIYADGSKEALQVVGVEIVE